MWIVNVISMYCSGQQSYETTDLSAGTPKTKERKSEVNLPQVIFSPDSGGMANTSRTKKDIKRQGTTKLNT